jgi:Dyp-type peroxidase family
MEPITEPTIELADIQGYVVRGYAKMMYSRYLLMTITDATAAKRFIHSLSSRVTNAAFYPVDTCTNIAFTAPGLKALGLNDKNLSNFTREYREGMTTPHRQRLLGDYDSSSPDNWDWGGPANQEVHLMLMLFGRDKDTTLAYYDQLQPVLLNSGLSEIRQLDGQTLPFNKEHFGFRDGISQPVIKGSGRSGPETDRVNTGEFLMGYLNEYNVYPDSPVIDEEQGDLNLLPADVAGSGKKDLGRNGSYLVVRQIEQDVDAYWTFMNDKTKNNDGSINETESFKLAAKMMGRWQSGAPIVKFPDADPGKDIDDNDFNYMQLDKDGLKCPFGSHLRRCNPRDNFEDDSGKESLTLTNRHRIIRRARQYGDPYEGSPTEHTPNGEVGLIFACFNADISRQFEFIQYTWANYPKFKQLYNDPDPVIGVRENADYDMEQNFTIQAEPVSKCITGLKRFIKIKGGAYFFFPSITTIRYLATL